MPSKWTESEFSSSNCIFFVYNISCVKREQKRCGMEIHDQISRITISEMETSDSKCNVVSVFPTEEFSNCKNLLAISHSYVCYSRKTLLRIINTVTSAKSVLRGHNSNITDLKFSLCGDMNLLCSVEEGALDSNKVPIDDDNSHIFIWRLSSEDLEQQQQSSEPPELRCEVLCRSRLRASLVAAHPLNPLLWCVASSSTETTPCMAIISCVTGEFGDVATVSSYSQLPFHASAPTGSVITGPSTIVILIRFICVTPLLLFSSLLFSIFLQMWIFRQMETTLCQLWALPQTPLPR
jgi:hypothetical protein